MSRSRSRERGRGWRRRLPVAGVGVCLLATLTFAWLAFGGVHHGARALLHGALALTLVAVLLLPERSLRHAGVVRPLALGAGLLLVPVALGLIVAPRGVRGLIAPGTVDARPGQAWWTLSLDPEATVGELCDLLLPLGALLVAAAWGAAWWRRSVIELTLRIAFGVVLVFGVVHAASGSTALLGVVSSSLVPGQRFFAPFVDPNHLATAIVLLLPPVLAAALDPEPPRSTRLGWAAAAVGGGLVLGWIGSSGALAAAAVVGALTLRRVAGWRTERSLAVVAVLGVAAAWAEALPGVTLADRVAAWGRAAATLPRFWLTGSGGGTFERATQPLHAGFTGWGHAHDDYVEWVLEAGLIGVLVLVPVATLWRSSPATAVRSRARAEVLVIGIVGVLVHALVDFPLQIPALAMAVAALWGLRRGAYEPRVESAPGAVRLVLVPFVALELLAAGWEARSARVEQALAVVRAEPDGAAHAIETLRRLAPWRPEVGLARALEANRRGDPQGAAAAARDVVDRHPDDPRALRIAGLVLSRNGDPDGARAAFDRAIARYPGDWRSWVARAQTAPRDQAAEAWREAFVAGAPARYLEEAWPTQPLGLVWLEVGRGREARFSALLGAFLASRGELETAALAYEQAWLVDPEEPPHPGYVRVLLDLGQEEDAARFLSAARARLPDDRRLQQLEAELLEIRGRPADAAELWLALARTQPDLLVRAMRATERAEGAERAIAVAGQQEDLGRRLDPAARLERARLLRDVGELAICSVEIKQSGLLGDARFGARAAALLRSCDQVQRAP